jgi:hypothetical protein
VAANHQETLVAKDTGGVGLVIAWGRRRPGSRVSILATLGHNRSLISDLRQSYLNNGFAVMADTRSLGLIVAFGLAAISAAAWENQRTASTSLAHESPALTAGLTASHKRIIYDSIASEQEQTLPDDPQLAVGGIVPESVILNAMPITVKDQVGVLKDFKFVKPKGDNILIVDPANRKIMHIITRQEAGR